MHAAMEEAVLRPKLTDASTVPAPLAPEAPEQWRAEAARLLPEEARREAFGSRLPEEQD